MSFKDEIAAADAAIAVATVAYRDAEVAWLALPIHSVERWNAKMLKRRARSTCFAAVAARESLGEACEACRGGGECEVEYPRTTSDPDEQTVFLTECPDCGGSGKRREK
jgi:hypothetical protein